jgi:hypothetical protein
LPWYSPTSQNDSLLTGLNLFKFEKGCRFETSQLVITGPLDLISIPTYNSVLEMTEYGLVKSLASAETFIERGSLSEDDFRELDSLLKHYNSSMALNGMSLRQIQQDL